MSLNNQRICKKVSKLGYSSKTIKNGYPTEFGLS